MNIKRILLIILFLILMLLLTGCVKKYKIDDIKQYIETKIGIKNYKLNEKYTDSKGEDGYIDHYWHVQYEDIEFDVIDDHCYAGESNSNFLKSNFKQAVLNYYGVYSISNQCINYYDDEYSYFLFDITSDGEGINDIELKKCYDDLTDFLNKIDFKKYPLDFISVKINNNGSPYRWADIYINNRLNSYEEFKNSFN